MDTPADSLSTQNTVYDNYFPDHNEINLDMDDILVKVFAEIRENQPSERNSEYVKKVNNVLHDFDPKEIEQFENKLKKLTEQDLLNVIEKAEALNFKLLLDYKNVLDQHEGL